MPLIQAMSDLQKLLSHRGLLPSSLVVLGWTWVVVLLMTLIYYILLYFLKKLRQ